MNPKDILERIVEEHNARVEKERDVAVEETAKDLYEQRKADAGWINQKINTILLNSTYGASGVLSTVHQDEDLLIKLLEFYELSKGPEYTWSKQERVLISEIEELKKIRNR